MANVKLQLETLSCPSCIKKIENTLHKQKGVNEATVMFNSSKVKIDFDEDVVSVEALSNIVSKLGYPVLSAK